MNTRAKPADDRWHWPDFGERLCGEMSERERLGLPDRFVRGWLDAAVAQFTSACRSRTCAALLASLADVATSLPERIACGNLLALAGDPRIDVLAPQMLDIPGGVVAIGLANDDVDAVLARCAGLGLDRAWIEKECPRHSHVLRPLRMARYPVTNGEYLEFLLATQYSEIPTSWHFRKFPHARANHPVYTVSATAADAYARWLAERTGRGFRLPSEAEWEWAAAGEQGCEFPWGSSFDPLLANTAECGLFDTSPVGAFVGGESCFGAADIAGNVEEYVADDYGPYPNGAFVADHLVHIHGRYRVARGGCFSRFRDLARTRRRHGHNPRSPAYAMGFRLAETR